MAPFASPEWIEGLARVAADAAVDPSLRLTVEQRVTGPEPVTWHFAFADGHVHVAAGATAEATITLTASSTTAADIHAGRLSAQRAFLDGSLRIGGDLNALIANRSALAAVAELLAGAT